MAKVLGKGQTTNAKPWTNEQKLLVRRLFKLRVHEAKGAEFQRLFEKVMQYRYPNDFVPIKPYGNVGDRKNDGYIPSLGVFHQVFAPEQPAPKQTAVTAAKKAKTDFAGMLLAWTRSTPIKVYRFVFNDEYTGCPPDVAIACAELGNKHGVTSMPFLAHHLEDEAMKLAPDELLDLVHTPIPRPDLIPDVDFSILNEVITFLLGNMVPLTNGGNLRAPDFSEKIEFNGLSSSVGHLLHTASRQIEAVNDYFSKNSTFAKQELRNKLNALYIQSKKRFNRKKDADEFGDMVFFDLLEEMVPKALRRATTYAFAQTAALVVMGFYFESCDVFEAPDALPR